MCLIQANLRVNDTATRQPLQILDRGCSSLAPLWACERSEYGLSGVRWQWGEATSIEVAPDALSQCHSLAGLPVSDTRPRPTATPSNLEGELNLAGVQCVSSSSPKLGPSERSEPIRKGLPDRARSAGGVCQIQRQNSDYQPYILQRVTSIEVRFL